MKDQLVRAISRDGTVNAVAVTTRYLTEEARKIHHTLPVATAALGRALAAASMMGNALKDSGSSASSNCGGIPASLSAAMRFASLLHSVRMVATALSCSSVKVPIAPLPTLSSAVRILW